MCEDGVNGGDDRCGPELCGCPAVGEELWGCCDGEGLWFEEGEEVDEKDASVCYDLEDV